MWDRRRNSAYAQLVTSQRPANGGHHVCSIIELDWFAAGAPGVGAKRRHHVGAMVRGLPGVAGAMFFLDRSEGEAMTLTLWETEEAALVSDEHAEASRAATVAASGVELVERGRFEVVERF